MYPKLEYSTIIIVSSKFINEYHKSTNTKDNSRSTFFYAGDLSTYPKIIKKTACVEF